MRGNSYQDSAGKSREAFMRELVRQLQFAMLILLVCCAGVQAQHIGKYVPIAAGSDADHAMQEINAATDPTQKLALIDKFAGELGQGNMALVADELYVNFYLSQKNYAKAYEYGNKLFALDADNFSNAINMVRAASEAGDAEKLIAYGETTAGILKRFGTAPAPAGISDEQWKQQKESALQSSADSIRYIQQAVYAGVYQAQDAGKRAGMLAKFAELFPDSPYANQALGVAATSYQQAQNVPKMLEVANGLIAKDPNNLGMLLLLADYYSEKGTTGQSRSVREKGREPGRLRTETGRRFGRRLEKADDVAEGIRAVRAGASKSAEKR